MGQKVSSEGSDEVQKGGFRTRRGGGGVRWERKIACLHYVRKGEHSLITFTKPHIQSPKIIVSRTRVGTEVLTYTRSRKGCERRPPRIIYASGWEGGQGLWEGARVPGAGEEGPKETKRRGDFVRMTFITRRKSASFAGARMTLFRDRRGEGANDNRN